MYKTLVTGLALLLLLAGCGGGDDAATDDQGTPTETASASADANADAESAGMPNPSSVYCAEQGGTEETREDPEGQRGVCIFPDGSECDSWAYYRKECAPGDQPAA